MRRLNAAGIIAIVNLHFSAPGAAVPDDQSPADADHSPAFWRSVATTFRTNHAVIFDMFNEPFPDGNRDTIAAWSCVLRGGACPGVRYKTAGMQQLVNTVRAVGATQPIMIAGPQYGGVLDRWLQFETEGSSASTHRVGPHLRAAARLALPSVDDREQVHDPIGKRGADRYR